ncbi:DNA cytosine methyltransferase [Acidithiobacillus sp. M4-SHS-6]|uniref:DNA cytosine methyltransferase n=1 Tax=Acidithiobacillus sp. M4-SHS-6 TaxID=3383024 RepID=UPI0039BDC31D
MRYLSLFSGIEAATVAWEPLGWECIGVSEIASFPAAVLAHHYPDVPNLGDVVVLRDQLMAGEDVARLLSHPPDIIVGGSPCQAWSVAGNRHGLADPRGQLTLVYAEIIHVIQPKFILWENVPGVLSSKDNGFGHLLGALAGHHAAIPVPDGHRRWSNAGVVAGPQRTLAWRILDAQYFGVPQRRRRVFLVGCAGTPRVHPGEILFELQGVRGDSAARRKTRKDITGTLASRTGGSGGLGTDFECNGGLVPEIAGTLKADTSWSNSVDYAAAGYMVPVAIAENCRGEVRLEGGDGQRTGALSTGGGKAGQGRPTVVVPMAFGGGNTSGAIDVSTACTTSNQRLDFDTETFIAEPIAFDCKAGGNTRFSIGKKSGTLRGDGHGGGHAAVAVTLQAAALRGRDGGGTAEIGGPIANTIRASSGGGDKPYVMTHRVRRLLPVECERLQGFPDNHTLVPVRRTKQGIPVLAADGPRYKAIGNSMAVPVMRWLGQRLEQFSGDDAKTMTPATRNTQSDTPSKK